jgi:3-hydroxyisobutyrate dehydrogenase
MKGFSAWPGKIDIPEDGMKRPTIKKVMHCVFFFGTHDFGWIPEHDLKPYQEFKDKMMSNKKSVLKAIDEIEGYIAGGCKATAASIVAASASAGKSSLTKKTKKDSANVSTTDGDGDDDSEFDALFSEKKAAATPASSKKKRNISADSDASNKKAKKGRMAKKARAEDENDTVSDDFEPVNHVNHRKSASSAVSSFLDRPYLNRPPPASPTLIDMSSTSKILADKDIQPSKLNFGFLGLGIMGSGIVKNLLSSGHSVTIWNRTAEKCKDFVKAGAKEALTPGDVIAESDITFSCVADPQAAKDMVFGNCGVLSEVSTTKGYVEMTGIDADTSQDIAEAISLKGGRYLEAQVQGSKEQSSEGSLVILVAGDKSLFDDCQSCFQAMGKNSFYLGEVGNASKMNLVLQLMSGVALAGLAEGMALADRAGLQQKDILEVLGLTGLACPMMVEKGKAIIEGGFPTCHPLQHMQKDLKLSLNMGDQLDQPLPLTASANEVFKHAKRLGYGDHDTSAVYIRARF